MLFIIWQVSVILKNFSRCWEALVHYSACVYPELMRVFTMLPLVMSLMSLWPQIGDVTQCADVSGCHYPGLACNSSLVTRPRTLSLRLKNGNPFSESLKVSRENYIIWSDNFIGMGIIKLGNSKDKLQENQIQEKTIRWLKKWLAMDQVIRDLGNSIKETIDDSW